jgi:hypothetical protein
LAYFKKTKINAAAIARITPIMMATAIPMMVLLTPAEV